MLVVTFSALLIRKRDDYLPDALPTKHDSTNETRVVGAGIRFDRRIRAVYESFVEMRCEF